MMKPRLKGLIIVLLVLCTVSLPAAPKLTVRMNGRWRVVLDDRDLLDGAGSNFGSPYNSAVDEIKMTISNSATTWTLYIKRVDGTWNSNMPLYIQRTGTGSGGTITGGDTYMEVTTTDQVLCTGSGTPSTVPFQLRLILDLPYLDVEAYDTSLEYTLVED